MDAVADYLFFSEGGEPASAPIDYIEMRLLPQQGWPYSEIKRLNLIERHKLFAMIEAEAENYIPPKDR